MITGPKYKIARRLGDSVFSKTQNPKFALAQSRRKDASKKRRGGARSEFATQLLEKQKVRYTYGLRERQFSNYVKEARELAGASPMQSLFTYLESRLDNVVFRLGFVTTRPFARQAVSHGHIIVNGRRVTIPSYRVRPGDVVSVRPESKRSRMFSEIAERLGTYSAPAWLSLDKEKLSGTVETLAPFSEHDTTLNFRAIIEFYSRV